MSKINEKFLDIYGLSSPDKEEPRQVHIIYKHDAGDTGRGYKYGLDLITIRIVGFKVGVFLSVLWKCYGVSKIEEMEISISKKYKEKYNALQKNYQI